MNTELQQVLAGCLRQMLRPIVRFSIRHSISIQQIIEALKATLLDIATEELKTQERKINVSRLTVLTGLHRQDILRLQRGESKESVAGHASRAITQWLGDRRFQTRSGEPRILGHEGQNCEFNRLVRSVCVDVHPGTVLFELKRIGAVEETTSGIKLTMGAYVPVDDPHEGFRMFATDATYLLDTVSDNVFEAQETRQLHVRTEFDNVDASALPKIKAWLFNQGNAFHQRARAYISRYDLDISPRKNRVGGGRVVVCSFGRVFTDNKGD